MRYRLWPVTMLLLGACGSSGAPGSSTLVLNDPFWERVGVQIVMTRSANCDERGEGFISSRQIVMRKNTTEKFEVPSGAQICWRHDRDPNNPVAGDWTGWTKATLFPGSETKTDL
jgi:hypothetical protein